MRYTNKFGNAVYVTGDVLDGLSLVYNGGKAVNGYGGTYTPPGGTPTAAQQPIGGLGSLSWGWTLYGPWPLFATLSSVGNTSGSGGAPSTGQSIQFNNGQGSFDIWAWDSAGSYYYAIFPGNYDTLAVSGSGWVLTRKDQTQFFFNAAGQLTQIVDTNSNQVNYLYSSNGNLLQVTDQQGRGFFFMAYEPNNNQPTVIYSKLPGVGNLLQLSYENVGGTGPARYILSSVTVQVANGTFLEYAFSYYYDTTLETALLQSVTEPQLAKTTGNPNPTQLVQFTYPTLGSTQVGTEKQSYVPASASPAYLATVQRTLNYTYGSGSAGVFSTMVVEDQDGVTLATRTSIHNFNCYNYLVSKSDGAGNATEYQYGATDPALITQTTDSNLNTSSTEWDNYGNILSTTDAQMNQVSYVIGAQGTSLANLVLQIILPTLNTVNTFTTATTANFTQPAVTEA